MWNSSGRIPVIIEIHSFFINSLITDLKASGLCYRLYRTPSTPVGYADDLATCSTSKFKLDRAINIAPEMLLCVPLS